MNFEEELDDEVCAIMLDHGPDGHVDGHDLLTAMVMRRIAQAVDAEREACRHECLQVLEESNNIAASICAGRIERRSNERGNARA